MISKYPRFFTEYVQQEKSGYMNQVPKIPTSESLIPSPGLSDAPPLAQSLLHF